jgi:hypothetical protein
MTADEHGEQEREAKHDDGEPDGELLQYVSGLRAPDLAGGGVTEGGAEAFLAWALHEHDENEQKADDDFDYGENSNEDVHKRGANMGGLHRLARASSHFGLGSRGWGIEMRAVLPRFSACDNKTILTMTQVLRAHYDGQTIVLDEKADLPLHAPLLVSVMEEDDDFAAFRREWGSLHAARGVAAAFGDNEPEYTLEDVIE